MRCGRGCPTTATAGSLAQAQAGSTRGSQVDRPPLTPGPGRPPRATVLGVRIDALRSGELTDAVSRLVREHAHVLVLNVNVHGLNLAYENPWLRDFFNRAEWVFPDGEGVVLAARFLGQRLPARITFADWIWDLAERAERERYSLYFLGAKPQVAEAAAQRLRDLFPQLDIFGIRDGYFDKRRSSDGNRQVVEEINRLRPDILLVGLGMPLQEKWLMDNWSDLDVKVALAVGGMFDFVSGRLRRAPKWMQRAGLEWLARLIIEPRRLWRRYVIGNPKFAFRLLRERLMLSRDRSADPKSEVGDVGNPRL